MTHLRATHRLRLATALTGALALATAGCSGVNSANEESSSTTDSAACSSDAGVTDDTVTLGVLTDLSGPVAAAGVPFSQGVQAFFDYANAELDGVDGRQIKVEVKDHAYDPQKALQAYREISDDVAGIPLSFGTAATNAVAAQIGDDCIPVMANASSELDRKEGVYYVGSTYEDNVLNGMDWYVNDQGHAKPKVALFYQADSYGEGAKSAMEFAADELGFELVSAQSYAPTDKSFSGQLSSIRSADPDLVVMASTVGPTFGFFGEAVAAGADWDWLGLQPTFSPAVFGLPIADQFQQDVPISYGGPVAVLGGEQIDLARTTLQQKFPDAVDNPPALVGWTAGYLFYNAMKNAADDGELTRGTIAEALADLDLPTDGLGPDEFTFDPDSSTPGVPTHADAIVQADKASKGLLKVLKPWFVSDLVEKYYDQAG